MTSNGPRESGGTGLRSEAAKSTVHHTGPTADRYQSALERYLAVVGNEASGRPEGLTATRHVHDLVGDVMTRGTVAAHEEAVFKEIVDALSRNRISAVPVVDSDRKVIGVVSESDLLTRVVGETGTPPRGHRRSRADTKRKLQASTAAELMTSPAVTVTPRTTVAEAARIAARAKVRRLPVVDDNGVLEGIVTRSDLLRVFLRDDSDIRRDVEQLIRYGTELDPATIGVGVNEGVVTLTGDVERRLQASRLVAGVRAVSGVVDVEDRLQSHVDDTRLPPMRPTLY